MVDASGGWAQVIVILFGIRMGVLYNSSRLSHLKNYVDAKFAANDNRFYD